MSPKKKDGKSKDKKIKRISEAEVFAIASAREEAAKQAAAADAEKKENDRILIEQLQLRGVRSLESDQYGEFTRITLTQPEPVIYDSDGIWKDLKPAKRELCFDRNVNLNALSPEARQKVIDVLTKDELREVTTFELNLERLAKSVSDGKIDKEVVANNSSIKPIAPSIRISHGSGS